MASVVLRQLDKIFPNGAHAVRALDLVVDDGQFMVLVGPSGSGKTTVLRLIAGLEDVTRGEILLGGEPVNRLAPRARNVAMVFQDHALYSHLTVRGNLEFPLRMRKVARAERRRRVEEMAEMLGLTAWLDARPATLSGGQRQRVAIGRCLVRRPAVFLLDEPLAQLDAPLRAELRAEIVRLQRKLRTTTLYVTHDQAEAMTMGDRIAVLAAGRLEQAGPSRQLYDRPANVFVARFLGSPGMNFFRTDLSTTENGAIALDFGGQRLCVSRETIASFGPVEDLLRVPLLAGLRPEAFSAAEAISAENIIRVKVTSVERLGHEDIVYFDPPPVAPARDSGPSTRQNRGTTSPMATRLPVRSSVPMPGDELILRADTNKLCLFDLAGKRRGPAG